MQSFSSQLYHWIWIAVENHVWLFLSLQFMLEGETMASFYKKLPAIFLIVVFAMKRLCVLSFI